jgi:hypothetical protein
LSEIKPVEFFEAPLKSFAALTSAKAGLLVACNSYNNLGGSFSMSFLLQDKTQ